MEYSSEASQEISRTVDNWIMSKNETSVQTFLVRKIEKGIVGSYLKILTLSRLSQR